MGIGARDSVDKLLVEKYANEVLICANQSTRIEDKNYLADNYDLVQDLGGYRDAEKEQQFMDIIERQKKLRKSSSKKCKEELQSLYQEIQDFVNPNKMYERLGVDVLCIQVSANLLSMADPNRGGSLLKQVSIFRRKMTDELGYIIPNVRIMDHSGLQDNAYCIAIRNKEVFTGNLSNEDLENNNPDEIINNLYKMCMKYAHQLVTKTDVLKFIELVRSQDPTLVNDLVPTFLSPIDLKHIFANLYQLKIGVKDILLVFEILNDYARYTQDRNELTEILKKELLFN